MATYSVFLLSDALPGRLRRHMQWFAFSTLCVVCLTGTAIIMSGNAGGMKDVVTLVGKMKFSACGALVSCATNLVAYSLRFSITAAARPEWLVLFRSRVKAVKAPPQMTTARQRYEEERAALARALAPLADKAANPATVVPV